MYRILLVAATQWELGVIKKEFKKNQSDYKNIQIDFLLSWIWNYNTIYSLQKQLSEKTYDFVLNIWVCWYSRLYPNGGDWMNSHTSIKLEVLIHPSPPLKKEGIAQCIQVARVKNMANHKELLVPIFLKFAQLESIISSETPVYNSELISPLLTREGVRGWVDMESYWVEYVCDKFQTPRVMLKVPVDEIWEETRNFDIQKAKKLLVENIDYQKLLQQISHYLEQDKINSKNNLLHKYDLELIKKIQLYYKMTVTEKIQFKKLYSKYKVLIEQEWWEKFEEFFEKNKTLSKWDFFVNS